MGTTAFNTLLNKIRLANKFSLYPSFETIVEIHIHWYYVLKKCYT